MRYIVLSEKFTYYVNRIQSIPKKQLVARIFRFILRSARDIVQESRIRIFPPRLSPEVVLEAQSALQTWREGNVGGLFINVEVWQNRIQLLNDKFPNTISLVIAEADQICDHIVDLLGSGPYQFGESLDWHLDFKSGYRFDPNIYYKQIHPAPYPGGYDIKVPWELSRCQHLPRLGQAYQITRDEKYTLEFVAQLTDWIESNPWPYGVNWNCSMEVALRAINWLWALAFFIESPHVGEKFVEKVAHNLYTHAEHIFHNLERSPEIGYAGNHYFSNLVGLIYLGICCPFYHKSKTWLSYGIAELEEIVKLQVWADGVDFESSISYHRLVTEMTLSVVWLCRQNSVIVPEIVLERLEKMLEFVCYYTKPDGTVPNIGDQDNGRLHRLGVWQELGREWLDHSYLVTIGRELLGKGNATWYANDMDSEVIWWLDEMYHQHMPESRTNLVIGSRAFHNGGFYFMRHEDLYMALRAGANGTCGLGGHAHNDIFGFELFAYDKTFIVDPGTFAYTGDFEARNLFRSSRYHNCLTVDDKELNRIPEQEPFRMENDAGVEILHWESNHEFDYFSAQHNGYARLASPVIHRRCIYFDKVEGCWLVRDCVQGEGRHKLALNIHFMPMRLVREHYDGALVFTDCTEGANLALWFRGQNPDCVSLKDGWVSRSYGTRIKAKIVSWMSVVNLPFELQTIIYPYENKLPSNSKLERLSNWGHDEFFAETSHFYKI